MLWALLPRSLIWKRGSRWGDSTVSSSPAGENPGIVQQLGFAPSVFLKTLPEHSGSGGGDSGLAILGVSLWLSGEATTAVVLTKGADGGHHCHLIWLWLAFLALLWLCSAFLPSLWLCSAFLALLWLWSAFLVSLWLWLAFLA